MNGNNSHNNNLLSWTSAPQRPPTKQSLAGETQVVEVLLVEDPPGKRTAAKGDVWGSVSGKGGLHLTHCVVFHDVAWASCLLKLHYMQLHQAEFRERAKKITKEWSKENKGISECSKRNFCIIGPHTENC